MAAGTARLEVHESHVRAMGTDAHLVIVSDDGSLLGLGADRVRELEGRWTRFTDTSEVSALNEHAGYPVMVSADTYDLVERSLAAWRLTCGRFDPTVGAALVAHGYDRDFAEIATAVVPAAPASPAPGPAGIELDPVIDAVTLPTGVTFDPGGIGKGLAADITAGTLIQAGAQGALVNLGGDLRALGRPPAPDGWTVTVPDPLDPDRELFRLALPHGAIAHQLAPTAPLADHDR